MSITTEEQEEIRRICKTRHRTNRLRMAAESLLDAKPEDLTGITILADIFYGRGELAGPDYEFVVWIVEHVDLSAFQTVVLLNAIHSFINRTCDSLQPIVLLFHTVGLIALASGIVLFLGITLGYMFLPFDLLLGALVAVVIAGSFIGALATFKHLEGLRADKLKRALHLISSLGNSESLGYIAKTLKYKPIKSSALPSLRQVVFRTNCGDFGTVSQRSMIFLRDSLKSTDTECALVILKAIERVGDGRCLQAVSEAATRYESPEVVAKANELLQVLKSRVEKIRISATLLRSADRPDHADGELLRVAIGKAEVLQEQLLTPIDNTVNARE